MYVCRRTATYLGSDVTSTPEMFRRIALSSSITNQLTCVWRQSRLNLSSCMHNQVAAIQSYIDVPVLLYGAETRTLIKSDEQKLEPGLPVPDVMSATCTQLDCAIFDFVAIECFSHEPNTAATNRNRRTCTWYMYQWSNVCCLCG